jgi:hypothetical protein
MDRKGLFSIDALLAVTLLSLVFMSFMNLYEGRNQAAQLMGARLEAKMVGEKLAAAINAVYAGGENFELLVNLPENLGSYSYRVTFYPTERLVLVENLSAWGVVRVTVPFENVRTYDNLTGDNFLESGTFEDALRVRWVENETWGNWIWVVRT